MRKAKIKHGLKHSSKDLELSYSYVRWDDQELKFHDAGRVSRKRVDTYFEKEPTTIAWMDTFTPDDAMLDVGCNVGSYAVYAGKVRGSRVFGFEPESLNYAELNKNIYLNGLHQTVRAFCCGASDAEGLDALYLSSFVPAFSHHDYGENRWEGPVTKLAPSREARLPQGIMKVRIDDCVARGWMPAPTHIKIDVDGLESKVVAGAWETINRPTTRTVLVETDFSVKASVDLITQMTEAGWSFSMDQVTLNRDGKITPEEWQRRLKDGDGGVNIVWFKDKFYDDYFKKAADEFKK